MKRKISILLICLLLFPLSALASERYTLETIERVLSGDTFKLKSGKKVRLIGVDAPENKVNRKAKEDSRRTGQKLEDIIEMGEVATEWVRSRLEGKKIFLAYDVQREGYHKEELAYAFLDDVTNFYGGIVVWQPVKNVKYEWWQLPQGEEFIFLNAVIIKGGYATSVRNPPNVRYADLFEQSYREAKENDEGLWNTDFFRMPCTKEGGRIGDCPGCIIRCCKGSMPIFDQVINGKCTEHSTPGAGGYCSNCGNDICESQQLEDSCNCPEDCK